MRILEVSRYKVQFDPKHLLPFVREQGEALRSVGHEVAYHLIEGRGMSAYLTGIAALRRRLLSEQPDVVHAHFGLSGITAVLAVRSLPKNKRPKCVVTFHNGETLTRTVNFCSSLFSLAADHVVYVAEHIRMLSYFKARRYSILPCGVPMDELPVTDYVQARRQLGMQPEKKYILFGGDFANKRKNADLLFAALRMLNRDDVEVLEMKGLSRAECALRMCACDVFALPTHSEGSPQALKEAMACNCPIVATDVADISLLLGQEQGHFLLRNPRPTKERWDGDRRSTAEMADLLQQALAFGRRTKGRERILQLGLDNTAIAQRLTEIYRQL